MAAPTTILTINKDMTYRNVPEYWSNTYMLTGATPVDSPAWRALFDEIVAEEKKCYTAGFRVYGGYGYDSIPGPGDHAVWTLDLRPTGAQVPGTLTAAGVSLIAGDQAAWVRWSLDRFNSNGKRVYLRKYFHGVTALTGGPDACSVATNTALQAFGTKMRDGTLASGRKICDKTGAIPIASTSSVWMTTRTLKRRGKRPPT